MSESNQAPGANTVESLAPLLKETYSAPRKKKKRFKRIRDLFKGAFPRK